MAKKSCPQAPGLKMVRDLSHVGDNSSFLRDWANRNEATFEHCMDMLAEEKPDRFVDMYLKVQERLAPKPSSQPQKLADTVNVSMNKIDTLAGVKDDSWKNNTNFADYDEIN